MLIFCPECHTLVAPYWKDCRYCGTRVDGAPASWQPRKPYSEAPPPELESSPPPQRNLLVPALPPDVSVKLRSARDRASGLLHDHPEVRVAGIVIASIAGLLLVCSAIRAGDGPAFSARSKFAAGAAVQSPVAALTEGGGDAPALPASIPTAPNDADEPTLTATAASTPAPTAAAIETAIEEATEPIVIDVAPADDIEDDDEDEENARRGRGNGRGRGNSDD